MFHPVEPSYFRHLCMQLTAYDVPKKLWLIHIGTVLGYIDVGIIGKRE